MLTRRVATLALCLLLAVAPVAGTPAVADAGCVGQSWGVACGVGVPGSDVSGGTVGPLNLDPPG